jgi:hypothetical protein
MLSTLVDSGDSGIVLSDVLPRVYWGQNTDGAPPAYPHSDRPVPVGRPLSSGHRRLAR